MGIVSSRVAWGSTICFPGVGAGVGGMLAFLSRGKQAAAPGRPCVFPGGVGGGMFAFSQANGKHARSALYLVSTPAQVHPLSTVSMPGNGKHTSSRVPTQHRIHASQMASTPAQVHPLSTVSMPGNGNTPPSQHCIHASQMVSTPGQRWEVPTCSWYCVQLLTIRYRDIYIYIYYCTLCCMFGMQHRTHNIVVYMRYCVVTGVACGQTSISWTHTDKSTCPFGGSP